MSLSNSFHLGIPVSQCKLHPPVKARLCLNRAHRLVRLVSSSRHREVCPSIPRIHFVRSWISGRCQLFRLIPVAELETKRIREAVHFNALDNKKMHYFAKEFPELTQLHIQCSFLSGLWIKFNNWFSPADVLLLFSAVFWVSRKAVNIFHLNSKVPTLFANVHDLPFAFELPVNTFCSTLIIICDLQWLRCWEKLEHETKFQLTYVLASWSCKVRGTNTEWLRKWVAWAAMQTVQ